MFLNLIAAVRSTETWAPFHVAAVLVVLGISVWMAGRVRVRRRR